MVGLYARLSSEYIEAQVSVHRTDVQSHDILYKVSEDKKTHQRNGRQEQTGAPASRYGYLISRSRDGTMGRTKKGKRVMIVTMRQGIQPLCTIHHVPMSLAQFGSPTALMVTAFKCDESDCTRSYNTSLGYFDIVKAGFLGDKEQQDCRSDGCHMFLEQVKGDIEIWSCGQVGCDYKQNFKRQPQQDIA